MRLFFLVSIALLLKLNAYGQNEFRLSVGLYEINDLLVDLIPKPEGGHIYSHHAVNYVSIEMNKASVSQRLFMRYLNLNHSINRNDYDPYPDFNDLRDYCYKNLDFGYSIYLTPGKQKLLSLGVGCAYSKNEIINQFDISDFYQVKSQGIDPVLAAEINLRISNYWHIAPSAVHYSIFVFEQHFDNRSSKKFGNLKRDYTLINSLRLTLKRTIRN